jgi:hypothetical protein
MQKFITRTLLLLILFLNVTANAATVTSKSIIVKTADPQKSSFVKLNKKMLEFKLGRKLTGKEKVALFLYNHKLLKPKKIDADDAKAIKWGNISILASIGGWLFLLLGAALVVPFAGILSFAFIIFGLVYGIKSLRIKKKNNPTAVLGVVFSGLYLVSILLAIAAFFLVFASI